MANASAAEEASAAWSQITECVLLYSIGGDATKVPAAECFSTASSCLARIRVITAPWSLIVAGIKHSRNVPGGKVAPPVLVSRACKR
eukprot:6478247-Amphidinium_carterae.2